MIVVREHFVAKPGQATKLATLCKEIAELTSPGKCRVLTDVTGDFNRVIMETEIENLSEFEARLKEYMSNPEWKKKMTGYTDMWITGGREFLRVV
jgi:hypothetical protein